jgi:hypothetical protein
MGVDERSGTFAADKRAVARAAQKSGLHKLFDDKTRLVGVEIPQTLKLPVRQTQAGALVELASDALQYGFKTGRAGHIAQIGRRSLGPWCGEQNARSRGARSPSG